MSSDQLGILRTWYLNPTWSRLNVLEAYRVVVEVL